MLAMLRRREAERPPAPELLAVIADPVFRADDPRLRRSSSTVVQGSAASHFPAVERSSIGGGEELDRLPHAGEEMAAILALAPAQRSWSALDFDADRGAVLGGRLARYSIVHFATHGVIDDRQPALSAILLAAVAERGVARDGRLRAYELLDLELVADLVGLSACRTAAGKEVRGEGLLGLAHGFFSAGAAHRR